MAVRWRGICGRGDCTGESSNGGREGVKRGVEKGGMERDVMNRYGWREVRRRGVWWRGEGVAQSEGRGLLGVGRFGSDSLCPSDIACFSYAPPRR